MGYCDDPSTGNTEGFIYDTVTTNLTPIPLGPLGAQAIIPYGINDNGGIVGMWWDFNPNDYGYGFSATSR